ncbi:MAG: MarR family transcriptional regulator [Alphaproteobacteria bacterium]|nr:MarR family transcriptional regulator [Alphaproteobacteria bacterium]
MPVNQAGPAVAAPDAESRLYLREEELDRAVELVFAAARRFWRAAEEPLEARGLGAAHYRALAAIRRAEPLAVSDLIARLEVRKQSLSRVLDDLERAGLIERRPAAQDRRQRLLKLTEPGRIAERAASHALRERLGDVFRAAGGDAVAGARVVLGALAAEDPA